MSRHPEMSHKIIDASGLHCPQPVIRCRAALAGMRHGELLHLLTTDPGSVREIKLLMAGADHVLVDALYRNNQHHFYIRKGRTGLVAKAHRHQNINPAGLCLMPC